MTSREPLITLENVSVEYWLRQGMFRRRQYRALEDISFRLFRGDSLGVVGKNGAGKSTLLRLLAGVMLPDAGRVINHTGATSSLLSLSLGFLPHLSGRENALLSGMLQGLSRPEMKRRLPAVVDFAELGEFIDQPLSSYSSGMVARLGFAVAFQVEPDILLIDEVIGVGDYEFQQKSMQLMKERIRSREQTVVFVSHNGSLIREVCNRAIWIEDRHVQIDADVTYVLGNYGQYLAHNKRPEKPVLVGSKL